VTAADVLRRAAAVLRETADAATPGPWSATDRYPHVVFQGDPDACNAISFNIAGDPNADAAFVSAMHPPVALAVAAWLDMTARWVNGAPTSDNAEHALAVARAVLREDQ
jgi:hypothetical protein